MSRRRSLGHVGIAAAIAAGVAVVPPAPTQAPVAPSSIQQTQQNTKQQAPAPTPVRTNTNAAVFLSRDDLPIQRRREAIWTGAVRAGLWSAGRPCRWGAR